MPNPYRDEKALAALVKFMKKPRTNREIREHFNVHRTTVHRWYRYLREDGILFEVTDGRNKNNELLRRALENI